MGESIEEAFSEILLAHLVGTTSLVCILGFQLLSNYAKGQNVDIATFLVYISSEFLVLYAHCVVGESLVTESHKVREAYYDCEWYEMPKNIAKCLILCMARSQKPLCLTAGKFGIFCLSTLTTCIDANIFGRDSSHDDNDDVYTTLKVEKPILEIEPEIMMKEIPKEKVIENHDIGRMETLNNQLLTSQDINCGPRSREIERIKFGMNEKFAIIFQYFSILKNVLENQILLTRRDIPISHFETPASVNL
ncbi:hypothetical protein PV327_003159 [Microctonus hyperodae]|uniref:Uncharacterized protein n=1 Tax=Microctonus hyperodae TaxID=165561 RepID=A0AA39G4C2_MICHY|nr:hypothetical protein PV327_003159 [Microctonus hyperodae]